MTSLCIGDLVEITAGRLLWSDLPPLGGRFEPLGRFVFDIRRVRRGDLLWCLSASCWDHPAASAEAFRRGACGIVAERFAAPWAGTFSLQVRDAREALHRLAEHSRRQFRGQMLAVAAGPQTGAVCRAIDAVLRLSLVGGVCPVLRRSAAWLPSGLAHIDEAWQYAIVPVFDLEKDDILRLSCPHLAVINPAAPVGRDRTVRRVLPWLPDSGHLIEAAQPCDAAVAVARRFGIEDQAAIAVAEQTLQRSNRYRMVRVA